MSFYRQSVSYLLGCVPGVPPKWSARDRQVVSSRWSALMDISVDEMSSACVERAGTEREGGSAAEAYYRYQSHHIRPCIHARTYSRPTDCTCGGYTCVRVYVRRRVRGAINSKVNVNRFITVSHLLSRGRTK